jgi:3-hydroxybutyryl-CoA dehydrogenase
MKTSINSVMIVGYGTMGRGIVETFAKNGFETCVLTRYPSRLDDLPEHVTAISDLPNTAPDLIIESIPEDITLKRELFTRLENAYGGASILATNTSGLPIDKIASPLAHKDKFIAVHYMQPADAFPLVEVCRLNETTDEVTDATVEALARSGKESIVLQKPVIGFLINRLQHALLHEAYSMIEDGIVSAADVDKFARRGFGPRMCVTGLIEQKDISGIDVNAAAQRSIVPDLNHSGKPCQMLQDMAARGDIGVKSGKGFYDWAERDIDAYRKATASKLERLWIALSDEE